MVILTISFHDWVWMKNGSYLSLRKKKSEIEMSREKNESLTS